MIPQSFIQDLLSRVDIVEVVGRYVTLKKAGANFKGLCPFHNEKSASFNVNPGKQIYKCFGCGVHGTAIGFLIEFSGLSFPEAVRELAQSVGMTVPDDDQRLAPAVRAREQALQLSLAEVGTRAMRFYCAQLKAAPRAIDYLKGRGLTGEIAKRFALGYAPPGWQNLKDAFDDYEDAALVEAGLVVDRTSESGQHRKYDRFRDRIMFPIHSTRGQVIGFGARIIDAGEPKYLNSPETPLFQKGHELYGLFEARGAIREAGYAIVVEGYMDVVALAQSGFANAVATLGTACTPMHVQKLVRHTDHVVFSFDGDSAGRTAAWRALEASLPHALDQRIFSFLFLPPEHDPDTFVRDLGAAAFRAEVKGALPLSAFLLREVCLAKDLGTAEGRAQALHEAKPLLRALPAGALRLQILAEMARLTHMAVEEIGRFAELTDLAARRAAPPRSARRAPSPLHDQVMRLLLGDPRVAAELTEKQCAVLRAEDNERLSLLLEVCLAAGPGATLATISDALAASPAAGAFGELIGQVLSGAETDRDTAVLDLTAAIAKLRSSQIRGELAALARSENLGEAERSRMRALMDEQKRLYATEPDAAEKSPAKSGRNA